MPHPLPPLDCTSLAEIRDGIDHLDRQIVGLLRERMAYVHAAAAFKPTERSIPAPERVTAMLIDRRAWAEQAGLPPDDVESLFAGLIRWFINQQTLHWRRQHGADPV